VNITEYGDETKYVINLKNVEISIIMQEFVRKGGIVICIYFYLLNLDPESVIKIALTNLVIIGLGILLDP